MPRLSDTMEEGTAAKWLVKVGDEISEGDILSEIETGYQLWNLSLSMKVSITYWITRRRNSSSR